MAGSFLMGLLYAYYSTLKLRLKFVSTFSTFVSVESHVRRLKVAKALLGLGAGRMWLELKVES
jgi:hypothetical protein